MFNCGFGKDAAGNSFCSIEAYHQTVRLSELFHLVERRLTPYYLGPSRLYSQHLAVGEMVRLCLKLQRGWSAR